MSDNSDIATFTIATGIIALFLFRPKVVFGEGDIPGDDQPGDEQLTSNILPILAVL